MIAYTTPQTRLEESLMVGLIPNLLLKLIESAAGPETVAAVLRQAGIPLERRYGLNRVYPDEEWQRLYAAARDLLGLDEDRAEAMFAEFFVQDALARFPRWFQMCRNSYEMLCLQPKIHNAFATGCSAAAARRVLNDKFRTVSEPHRLIVEYRSPNRLCGLYVKLARCIATHYGDEVDLAERECVKWGANRCLIEVAWRRLLHG
ncbi:MAG: heme NO-binding domain-containing protein [Pirellulales bacterium]|nr:heme NO-binding domain-containing protein [Pirellulales bacterium]